MNILTEKNINCDKYIDRMFDLDISQIELLKYHILDDSRVRVQYEFGYDINYGDLYVKIAHTDIVENIILEEFIVKAYRAYNKGFSMKGILQSAKKYFNTNLIPLKKEEVEIQFRQWFNNRELDKLNINFEKIKESAYIGEIDFYDEIGYQGFILFITDDKIYFVNFISSI